MPPGRPFTSVSWRDTAWANAIAVYKNIGEPDLRQRLPERVRHLIDATHECPISINVGTHVFEVVRTRPSLGDTSQCLLSIMHPTLDIGILKFVRQQTAYRLGIMPLERLGPDFLKPEQCVSSFACPGSQGATQA
jgi:hypothetical protein